MGARVHDAQLGEALLRGRWWVKGFYDMNRIISHSTLQNYSLKIREKLLVVTTLMFHKSQSTEREHDDRCRLPSTEVIARVVHVQHPRTVLRTHGALIVAWVPHR